MLGQNTAWWLKVISAPGTSSPRFPSTPIRFEAPQTINKAARPFLPVSPALEETEGPGA